MDYPIRIEDHRHAEYPADALFLKRWSPRSMNGTALDVSTLMILLEAARWAPSSGNSQPWRFVYAIRSTPGFDRLLDTLNPGNRVWCVHAGALILAASQTGMERKGQRQPLPTHAFDAGSAWMSLALQGSLLNLVTHAMAGFDAAQARQAVSMPEGCEPHAMIAVGYPAAIDALPDSLREREKPSGRAAIFEFAFDGQWPGA